MSETEYQWFVRSSNDRAHILDHGHALCSSRIVEYQLMREQPYYPMHEMLVAEILRPGTLCKRCVAKADVGNIAWVAAKSEASAIGSRRERHAKADRKMHEYDSVPALILACPIHGWKWEYSAEYTPDKPGHYCGSDEWPVILPCGCKSYKTYDREHETPRFKQIDAPSIRLLSPRPAFPVLH